MLQLIEHAVFSLVLAVLISIYYRKGPQQFFRVIVLVVKELPGVRKVIDLVLRNEVSSFVRTTSLAQDLVKSKPRVLIPETGTENRHNGARPCLKYCSEGHPGSSSTNNSCSSPIWFAGGEGLTVEELRERMKSLQRRNVNPERDGNVFAYQYTLHDDNFILQQDAFDLFCEKTGHSVEHDALVWEFFQGFMHENALNPMIYPALRLMETEVVSMTAAMLNGNSEVVGFLTSGGTESNLMAVKTFRDMALATRPNIRKPNIVAPITVHPTIDKAAHYFGLEVIHTPMTTNCTADFTAMERAINSDTVMLCASAPQFCHAIMDPIEEIAALAVKKGLPLHVDACFGGFMLPWVEQLGYPVQKFDFRIPGVTSMSADVHKYGFCVKGASVIYYRNSDIRKYQIYAYSEWPGGLYGSPSMAGTRPGGNIAAAWAAMKALGKDGYMDKAKVLMDTTLKMITRIKTIKGLYIMGEPCMTAFAIGARDSNINIQAVADAMETKGWKIERNQLPDSIHCSILPHHIGIEDKFLDDLKDAANYCWDNKGLAKKGTAGVYGMMANIPDKGIVTDFLVEFFECK